MIYSRDFQLAMGLYWGFKGFVYGPKEDQQSYLKVLTIFEDYCLEHGHLLLEAIESIELREGSPLMEFKKKLGLIDPDLN